MRRQPRKKQRRENGRAKARQQPLRKIHRHRWSLHRLNRIRLKIRKKKNDGPAPTNTVPPPPSQPETPVRPDPTKDRPEVVDILNSPPGDGASSLVMKSPSGNQNANTDETADDSESQPIPRKQGKGNLVSDLVDNEAKETAEAADVLVRME